MTDAEKIAELKDKVRKQYQSLLKAYDKETYWLQEKAELEKRNAELEAEKAKTESNFEIYVECIKITIRLNMANTNEGA